MKRRNYVILSKKFVIAVGLDNEGMQRMNDEMTKMTSKKAWANEGDIK